MQIFNTDYYYYITPLFYFFVNNHFLQCFTWLTKLVKREILHFVWWMVADPRCCFLFFRHSVRRRQMTGRSGWPTLWKTDVRGGCTACQRFDALIKCSDERNTDIFIQGRCFGFPLPLWKLFGLRNNVKSHWNILQIKYVYWCLFYFVSAILIWNSGQTPVLQWLHQQRADSFLQLWQWEIHPIAGWWFVYSFHLCSVVPLLKAIDERKEKVCSDM